MAFPFVYGSSSETLKGEAPVIHLHFAYIAHRSSGILQQILFE